MTVNEFNTRQAIKHDQQVIFVEAPNARDCEASFRTHEGTEVSCLYLCAGVPLELQA